MSIMENEILFQNLKNNIKEGYALFRISSEKESSLTLKFIDINNKFEDHFNIKKDACIGKKAEDITPEINTALMNWYDEKKAISANEPSKNIIEKVKLHGDVFNIKLVVCIDDHLIALFEKLNESLLNENVLNGSYADFKILFDNSPLGIYIADINGNILDGNEKLLDLLGSPSLEATKRINVLDYPPLIEKGYADSFRMSIKTGETQKIEMDYVSNWGTHNYLSSYIVPVKDDNGKVKRVYTLMEDITKRKHIEKDLQTEKQRLANIIEGTQAGSWQWNIQTGELILNEKWFEMLGYKSTDFSSHTFDTWARLTHPEDKKKSERKLKEHFDGHTDHYENELRMRHKNGEWIWMKDRGKLITRTENGEPFWMFGTHLNITDRKKYEEKLKEREELLQKLTNHVPGVIYQYRFYPDGSSRFPYASKGINEIYEVTPAEVLNDGSVFFERIHKDDLEMVKDSIKESFETLDIWKLEYRVVLPQKGLRWLSGISRPEKLADGSVLWHGYIQDITERKRVEQAYRESEEKISKIGSAAFDAVIMINDKGNIEYWNPAAERIFGYKSDEVMGEDVHKILMPKKYEEDQKKGWERFKLDGNGDAIDSVIESTALNSSNKEFPVEIALSSMKIKNKNWAIAYIRDITGKKKNEQELIDSRRELSEAQKIAKLGSWELDLDEKMITLSEEHQFMIGGKSKEETMPLSEYAARYIIEQDIPIIQDRYEFACDNIGNDNYKDDFEYRIKTNIPGEYKYLLVNSRFKRKGVISGVTQDITERKKAENLIKEREEQFRTIFNNSPQPMALTEVSTGKILEVNNIFCKKTGFSKDYLLGKTTVEHGFYSEDDRDMFKKELLNNGYVDGLEMTFYVTEELMFICKMYATFITINARKYILTTFYDITDQKKAEDEVLRQKEQFELAVNGTNDGIWDWDIKTNDLYLSKRWKEMLGYEDHELQNEFETFSRNIHPDDKPRVFEFVGKYLEGKIDVYEIELRMKHKDGSYRWILAKGEALRDENNIPYRMAGSHSDITERKEMERRIIKEKEKAEQANRAKSEFLANMSHEIRTPMNSILGFSEVMLNTTTDEKNKSYLKTILSSGKTLLTLINDILDLSKIEAGRMQISPEPVSVRCVINEMKQIFKQKTDEKNLDFIVEIDDDLPGNITIDEVRLRQILLNLIGNAVKFTSEGYVKTEVTLLNESNGIIDFEIAVIDTGIGIAENDKKQIFDSFSQQSGQDAKRYGGTGLGLAITKRLCELMNGRIDMESKLGKGSKFVVSFRNIKYSSQKISEEDADEWNEENVDFLGANVLIVDDVPHNRDLIVSYLESYDLKINTADNGKMSVDLAMDLMPDLILMDIRMPGLNGYEATEIIKSNKKTKHIPIIALTASTTQTKKERIIFEIFFFF